MSKKRITWWALFLMSLLFSRMYLDETLAYYVLPWFTHIMLGVSIILGLISLYLLTTKNHLHHVDHHVSLWQAGVLIVVVFLWAFVPKEPLSYLAIANRGIQYNLSQIRIGENPGENNVSDVGLTFPDVIRYIQENEQPSDSESDNYVHVRGFAHSGTSGVEDEFSIVQFQMSCCIADARPVGLRIQSWGENPFEDGTWIEVLGTLSYSPLEDENMNYVIIPESMEEVELLGPPFFY